jgi:hypothetical protein
VCQCLPAGLCLSIHLLYDVFCGRRAALLRSELCKLSSTIQTLADILLLWYRLITEKERFCESSVPMDSPTNHTPSRRLVIESVFHSLLLLLVDSRVHLCFPPLVFTVSRGFLPHVGTKLSRSNNAIAAITLQCEQPVTMVKEQTASETSSLPSSSSLSSASSSSQARQLQNALEDHYQQLLAETNNQTQIKHQHPPSSLSPASSPLHSPLSLLLSLCSTERWPGTAR